MINFISQLVTRLSTNRLVTIQPVPIISVAGTWLLKYFQHSGNPIFIPVSHLPFSMMLVTAFVF